MVNNNCHSRSATAGSATDHTDMEVEQLLNHAVSTQRKQYNKEFYPSAD